MTTERTDADVLRHNYLKRVEDERRAYDVSKGVDHAKNHIAAAFGYASVSEMNEAIKVAKAKVEAGRARRP